MTYLINSDAKVLLFFISPNFLAKKFQKNFDFFDFICFETKKSKNESANRAIRSISESHIQDGWGSP